MVAVIKNRENSALQDVRTMKKWQKKRRNYPKLQFEQFAAIEEQKMVN